MHPVRVLTSEEQVKIRIHDAGRRPVLIYLPGLHGDWTLAGGFRRALVGRACLVETAYPRVTDWSLETYARNISETLCEMGIRRGWIIGESFGSQIAWLLARQPDFQAEGIVLAGGFVRHPAPWGVALGERISRGISMKLLSRILRLYGHYACARHRSAEAIAEIREFVARRSDPTDRLAIIARYRLLLETDLRETARATTLPVYSLYGFFDPIVPWPWVRCWLRRNCPGFRGHRMIFNADHNVLGTAPSAAAEQILHWVAPAGIAARSRSPSTAGNPPPNA